MIETSSAVNLTANWKSHVELHRPIFEGAGKRINPPKPFGFRFFCARLSTWAFSVFLRP